MNRGNLINLAKTPLLSVALVATATALLSGQTIQPEAAKAPTYSVLHTFSGGVDGANPTFGKLVQDGEGNFYGVALNGGEVSSYCPDGCGLVFKLDRAGKLSVIHTFTGPPDGADPIGQALFGFPGRPVWDDCCRRQYRFGCGDSFKIDRFGRESILYNFSGGADGNSPYSGVIPGADGTLYGTTLGGGTDSQGVIFKLDRAGNEQVLYNFTGGADGSNPGGLLQDPDGTLYGTTQAGGPSNAGMVYKLKRDGSETVLYSFTGGQDGSYPENLIRDAAGNFFGTAAAGGAPSFLGGTGVVFQLTPRGKLNVVYTFQGSTDGSTPYGELLLQNDKLYGTTFFGGDPNGCVPVGCGVVYELDLKGKETVLYTFTGGADGGNPYSGLTVGRDGSLTG